MRPESWLEADGESVETVRAVVSFDEGKKVLILSKQSKFDKIHHKVEIINTVIVRSLQRR